MRPAIQAHLINGECGDPALYLRFAFQHRALLFDLGDIAALSSRQILAISHIFVSHTHMDHFAGFDRLLRVCLGRPARVLMFGPEGFADRVAHKLSAYSWNLVGGTHGLEIVATELAAGGVTAVALFRAYDRFQRGYYPSAPTNPGVGFDDGEVVVRYAVLDHDIPSLAFAIEEPEHINIWKDRVTALGLAVGPWLTPLKHAVRAALPDDTPIRVQRAGERHFGQSTLPLGYLKQRILRLTPGQKISYVVDAAIHDANADKIVTLARGSDHLFIEAVFLENDVALALAKHHLTAGEAGRLASLAGAKRMTPFHFSPRYGGREDLLRAEAARAFGTA